MSARDKFNGVHADYWDCSDPEGLTHEDPISALEEWIDSHLEPGCDTEAIIREMGNITVEAYERDTISDGDIQSVAEQALDAACEYFCENFGDPEGDDHDLNVAQYKPAFEAAVRALYADTKVWRCSVTSTVELTPDEAIEIMRVERPDWFAPGEVG